MPDSFQEILIGFVTKSIVTQARKYVSLAPGWQRTWAFFLTAISRIEFLSTSELRDKRGYSFLAHPVAITFLIQVSSLLSLEKAKFYVQWQSKSKSINFLT